MCRVYACVSDICEHVTDFPSQRGYPGRKGGYIPLWGPLSGTLKNELENLPDSLSRAQSPAEPWV